MQESNLPFLDFEAPGFSTRGPEVLAARELSWIARSPFGYAILRYHQAGLILRDRRFRQGSYAWPKTQNLEGPFADFWCDSVISREGADHKAQRRLVMDALDPDWVDTLKATFTQIAEHLCAALKGASTFDFVDEFTEPFAGQAIAALLGLSQKDADQIAKDAAALGLAMGVGSKQYERIFNPACKRLFDLASLLLEQAACGQDRFFAGRLFYAAQRHGFNDRAILQNLIVICIFGGVDTTRAQLALAIRLFMENPCQWDLLVQNPDLAENAIEDAIRQNPTTTWATREATEDVLIDGILIPRGATVHVLVHATATSNELQETRFEIKERKKMHFGFGGGAHHCLGQYVARTDMACALKVLAKNCRRFQLAGEADWGDDSGNTGPVKMPVICQWVL